jgi:hypothetical protein
MSWLRWWTGTVNDPKWRLVARRANSKPGNCVAVWAYLLELAKPGEGNVSALDVEECSVVLDYEIDEVERIIAAMRDRSLLDGDRVASWERRQPKREDDSAARVAAYRAKKREETQSKQGDTHSNAPVTQCNAPETDTETEVSDGKPSDTSARAKPTGKAVNSKTRSGAQALADGFSRFWARYPHKVSKNTAAKAWFKAAREHGEDAITGGLERAMAMDHRFTRPIAHDGRCVTPHAATWLNAQGFLDEPASHSSPNPRTGNPGAVRTAPGTHRQATDDLASAGLRRLARLGAGQGYSAAEPEAEAPWGFPAGIGSA